MRVCDASEVIQHVGALHGSRGTVLVAIDGLGGAGKTWLARSIADGLTAAGVAVTIVHVDDFYLPSALRPTGDIAKSIGYDFDWMRLRDQVLIPLRRGETARYDRYDWECDALADVLQAQLGNVVLVEGVYSSRREIGAMYDSKIWVDCPRELRLRRGLERDGEAARGRWEHDWMPSEDRYVEEHRPHQHADMIVRGFTV